MEDLVPNFGTENYSNITTGCHSRVPKVPTSSLKYRTRYYNSFGFFGFRVPELFNILLKNLRDLIGGVVDFFKLKLDHFLSGIPDETTS